MIRYAAGRLLAIVPVLFGVSVVVFLLIRLIPGNPAIAILGERATPELIARVQNQLGLDLPIWRQYLHFLGNVARGDFGLSFFYQQEVTTLTLERIPITLALIGYAMAIGLVVALLLSVKLRLLPLGGVGAGGFDTLRYLTLPALTIALHLSPILVRAL